MAFTSLTHTGMPVRITRLNSAGVLTTASVAKAVENGDDVFLRQDFHRILMDPVDDAFRGAGRY